MSNEYPTDVRRTARRLWLTGRHTDEQIAAQLGIPRADTIRDWRHDEEWVLLAWDLREVVKDETQAAIAAERGAVKTRYHQIGQALENKALRYLADPDLSPRDLRAVAGALAVSQKIRELALPADREAAHERLVATVAGAVRAARERRELEQRRMNLGRARTHTAGGILPEEPSGDPSSRAG